MTKKLIINADDYGMSEEVNERIVECYTKGAVTDISILAVGDSFKHAVKLAKKNRLDKIGVHLALTGQFKALSPIEEIPTLVDKSARFSKSYPSFLFRYFIGGINVDEIYRELRNQLLRAKSEGFKITHLDSHEHVHVVPGILRVVARLMKEEGVDYVRFPLERTIFFTGLKDIRALVRNILLSSICRVSKRILDIGGLKYNDYFMGHAYALGLKREEFISALSHLQDGLTEFCCHPGNRDAERKLLCNKGFVDELKRRSIELVSY